MDLRGAVLNVPIMLRVALNGADHRAEAVGVACVARHLYANAVAELGEVEAEDLAGATLQYVRDRIMAVYGETAWEEAVRTVVATPSPGRVDSARGQVSGVPPGTAAVVAPLPQRSVTWNVPEPLNVEVPFEKLIGPDML
jgi:hypothetical protein